VEINAESFWLQKAGCSAAEYEDAFCPEGVTRSSQQSFRFAVADGATDSSFSGIWARLLVKEFVEGPHEPEDIEQLLASTQPRWEQQVGQRQLPWYAEEKAQAGAFSSLLGLTIRETDEGRSEWQAIAVGDSCLVQVRNEKAIVKFPIEHSSRFDSMPFLLATTSSFNSRVRDNLVIASGDIRPDDAMYLMTDALACWFMAADERGQAPWLALRDLNTGDQRESFVEMVDRLRTQHELRNDDCTLIRIDIF
jgi:hypothetical protein